MGYPRTKDQALNIAQKLINEQGFLILATKDPSQGGTRHFEIGDITTNAFGFDLEQPLKIVSRATRKQWDAETELARQLVDGGPVNHNESEYQGVRFWKAVTD